MTSIIGFTGTRKGMTDGQRISLARIVDNTEIGSAVHGGAIGADEEFDALMVSKGIERLILPSNLPNQRMARQGGTWLEPQPPLERNRAIVDACDFLVAAPEGPETVRSGTWSTIRYARKKGRQVTIIWPNGVTTSR